jgi:hypothetical protein
MWRWWQLLIGCPDRKEGGSSNSAAIKRELIGILKPPNPLKASPAISAVFTSATLINDCLLISPCGRFINYDYLLSCIFFFVVHNGLF